MTKKSAKRVKANVARVMSSKPVLSVPKVIGSGGYFSDNVVPFLRKVVPAGTFAKAGNFGGEYLGNLTQLPGAAPLGAHLGSSLGSQLAKLVGFGDYSVKTNSILRNAGTLPEGSQIPSFGNAGHETRIAHREFIRDIVVPATPATFTNISASLNPGNSVLFPWLSQVSTSFDQYRFYGCVFEFRSLSSDITAGGSLGSVVMAMDYDAVDAAFSSKIQMENSEYAVSCKPSLSMVHCIECDPALTAGRLYYLRDSFNSSTANTDARFYDMGNFQIATVGLPGTATQVLGELWVTYDVGLFKPDLGAVASGVVQSIVCSTGVSNSVTFGTAPAISGSGLFAQLGNTLTILTVGSFVMVIHFEGTVLGAPVITGTAAAVSGVRSAGFTTTKAIETYTVTTSAINQTIIVTMSNNTTTTITALDMILAPSAVNFG